MGKVFTKRKKTVKSKRFRSRLLSIAFAVVMVFSVFPGMSMVAEAATIPTLTFSDEGITETVTGSGYKITDTTLTINSAGTYILTGSCSEGSVAVKKGTGNVVLIMKNLSLACSTTAPVAIKKTESGGTQNNAVIHISGEVTLTDNETDTTLTDYEGAALKVGSGSALTICGDGTLNINGYNNGIKGGTAASVTINSGVINVGTSSDYIDNNGIAADGSVVLNGGTFNIYTENDGIKSVPDEDDTTSDGGDVTINGGTYTIRANGDGIQAEESLVINNGSFDIKTLNGYNGSGFNSDTMSCKGIKTSGDRDGYDNTLEINGGEFTLDTADDAIHSDTYVTITGGTFDIYTGDDGVHADTTLILGTENGYERDPEINIYASYEGLEAGTIYTYSGKYWVVASDDGINAGGGSSNGSDPGNGGGNNFNPGGGKPGAGNTSTTSNYNAYFRGGDFYVDCKGDGLDSNGGLYLYGGNYTVLSQAPSGDNSPLDSDGTLLINGATVFAAGINPMNETPASSSQKYTTSTTNYSANSIINVKSGSTTLYTEKLPRSVSYILYSSPDVSSSVSFSTGSLSSCKSNAWAHNWDSGKVDTAATKDSDGTMVYTCSDCGDKEYKTIKLETAIVCDGHISESETEDESVEDETADEGYTVTFNTDDGVAGIDVYYTQDYTTADETDVTSTVSRNSDTREPDSTGEGQINFLVRLTEGYSIDSVAATEGTYKNIKTPSDTGVSNVYRITKISGDTTVTITTTACTHNNISNVKWSWEDGYSKATIQFDCSECEQTVSAEGSVTSALNTDGNIEFTALYTDGSGTDYTDTKIDLPYTATFSVENATIDVYYTQDYSNVDEQDVQSAVARDGGSGYPVISGDGQINFKVNPNDGYEVDTVTATAGTYKNIKEQADNTYRITKITGDTTITVTTKETSGNDGSDGSEEGGDNNEDDTTSSDDAGTEGTTTDTDSSDASTTDTGTSTSGTGASTTDTSTTDTSTTGASTTGTSTTGTSTSTSSGTTLSDTTSSSDVTTGSSTSTYAERLAQKGEDGTAVGKGASYEAAEQAITTMTSDTDPKGSRFGVLCARAIKTTKTSVKLKWNKVSGAVKYVIYANKCGKKNKCVKVAEITKNTYAYTKLKKGTYYKFIVVAIDSDNNVISTSKLVHAATTGGKVGNCKKVTTKGGTTVTLKVGRTYKLNGKAVKGTLTVKKHRTAVCYESSDSSIATVTSKGVIKGVSKGTCYIYAYAQNGSYKKIKLTVK